MTSEDNSETFHKVTKKEMISEISNELNIRSEVVEVVLNKFIDVTIEKIVNNEEFSLMNVFSVSSHREGNAVIPANPHSGTESKKIVNRKKLRSRLSRTLRTLYRLQNDQFPDKPYIVNRNNWRDALKWVQEGNKAQSKTTQKEPIVQRLEEKDLFMDNFDKFFEDDE